VLGVTLEGHKEVLGHWVSDGAEGASFWLGQMLSDLQRVLWVSGCSCWAPRPLQRRLVDDATARRLPTLFRRESVPSCFIA